MPIVLALVLSGCRPDMPRLPVPSIRAVPLQSDLGNLANRALLPPIKASQQDRLVADSFLVTDSDWKEFYQAYLVNPSPFITTDSVLHAYTMLVNDSLEAVVREHYGPALEQIFSEAVQTLEERHQPLYIKARNLLKSSLARIEPGSKNDPLGDLIEPRHRHQAFVNSLGTTTIPIETDEEIECALILSLALESSPTWKEYLKLAALTSKLTGKPDEAGPQELLHIARQASPDISLDHLDAEIYPFIRRSLNKNQETRVRDQRSPRPAIRLLPPGVTLKSLAFDQIARSERRMPTGQDLLKALDQTEKRSDLHSETLRVLKTLTDQGYEGYPLFMQSRRWKTKTANTRLGAWAELEHAVAPFAKDNGSYLGGYLNEPQFPGYVEPEPWFYDSLRTLTNKTRQLLAPELAYVNSARLHRKLALYQYVEEHFGELRSQMGVALSSPVELALYLDQLEEPGVEHFQRLESLLGTLSKLSAKEFENEPFTRNDEAFLKNYGEVLKALSLNTNNIDDVFLPGGIVTPVFEDFGSRAKRYAATGRPLSIKVAVPYKGKLYYTEGAIYSYYEFDRPSSRPLGDGEWKENLKAPVSEQKEKPGFWGGL